MRAHLQFSKQLFGRCNLFSFIILRYLVPAASSHTVYIYIYIYTHTHTHTHIHTHVYIYTVIYMHSLYIYIYIYISYRKRCYCLCSNTVLNERGNLKARGDKNKMITSLWAWTLATPDNLERHLVLSNKYLYLSDGTISYYFWNSHDQILHVSKFNAC